MWTEHPPGLPMSSPLEEFVTSDGRMLRSTVFTPDRARALAIFIPACGGQLEQYLPIALTMARAGVIVVVPSPRARHRLLRKLAGFAADGRSLTDLLELLRAAQREHPSVPILMGAHSTACSLLVRAIPRLDTAVHGVFFIDPTEAGDTPSLRRRAPWRRVVQTLSDASSDRMGFSVPLFAALTARRFRMFGSIACNDFEWHDYAGSRTLVHVASPDQEDALGGTCIALRRWLIELMRPLDRERVA